MLTVKNKHNEEKSWDTLTFWEDGAEIGTANITIYQKEMTLYSIESYQKGAGTKMIHYLKSWEGIQVIRGDVGNDSHDFWEKVGANVEDDEFEILLNENK